MSLLAVLAVLAGPLVVPLLHAAEPSEGARVESSHDPDRCRVLHDHLACAQLQGSAPLAGRDLVLSASDGARRAGPDLGHSSPAPADPHDPCLPRAPPGSGTGA